MDFVNKYNLEIIPVINPSGDIELDKKIAYTGSGKLINSQFLNDLSIEEAKKEIIERVEELHIGKKTTNFRLRDWVSLDRDIGDVQFLLCTEKMVR